MQILITDLERAINHWRQQHPTDPHDPRLCAEAAALAMPYVTCILEHRTELTLAELSPAARAAYLAWHETLGNQSGA